MTTPYFEPRHFPLGDFTGERVSRIEKPENAMKDTADADPNAHLERILAKGHRHLEKKSFRQREIDEANMRGSPPELAELDRLMFSMLNRVHIVVRPPLDAESRTPAEASSTDAPSAHTP